MSSAIYWSSKKGVRAVLVDQYIQECHSLRISEQTHYTEILAEGAACYF